MSFNTNERLKKMDTGWNAPIRLMMYVPTLINLLGWVFFILFGAKALLSGNFAGFAISMCFFVMCVINMMACWYVAEHGK